MSAPAIELRGVRKRFGSLQAVKDLDLVVPRGATYGLLGPNGAGKTTTIRMVLRIIEPDTGEIRLFGEAAARGALDRVGYLPEERGLYRRMRASRLLAFYAELKGMPPAVSAPRIREWLDRLGLADRADAVVKDLSKGMQQKLQFISAVLHEPELVVLDEPFSGLDPINQRVLKDIIVDLQRNGRTIVFSTHIIEHAERICDHVCIIARGEKVVDGPVPEVRRRHGDNYLRVTFESQGDAATGLAALRASRSVSGVRAEGVEAEVRLRSDADSQAVLRELVEGGLRLRRFERIEPSLEQIFLERVGAQEPALEDANV